jgi:hypothetical protein
MILAAPVLPRRRTLVALALVALISLTIGALVAHSGGNSNSPSRAHARAWTYTSGDRSFSVTYPNGWKAGSMGPTGAVIERADHRGLVLIREHAAIKGSLSTLVKSLPGDLARRFADFRPAGASVARLSTGPAVVYTFVRTKAKKVQSIVIAPAARRSFTLEVVAPTGAHDAARQAGQIVRSLKSR